MPQTPYSTFSHTSMCVYIHLCVCMYRQRETEREGERERERERARGRARKGGREGGREGQMHTGAYLGMNMFPFGSAFVHASIYTCMCIPLTGMYGSNRNSSTAEERQHEACYAPWADADTPCSAWRRGSLRYLHQGMGTTSTQLNFCFIPCLVEEGSKHVGEQQRKTFHRTVVS